MSRPVILPAMPPRKDYPAISNGVWDLLTPTDGLPVPCFYAMGCGFASAMFTVFATVGCTSAELRSAHDELTQIQAVGDYLRREFRRLNPSSREVIHV